MNISFERWRAYHNFYFVLVDDCAVARLDKYNHMWHFDPYPGGPWGLLTPEQQKEVRSAANDKAAALSVTERLKA